MCINSFVNFLLCRSLSLVLLRGPSLATTLPDGLINRLPSAMLNPGVRNPGPMVLLIDCGAKDFAGGCAVIPADANRAIWRARSELPGTVAATEVAKGGLPDSSENSGKLSGVNNALLKPLRSD